MITASTKEYVAKYIYDNCLIRPELEMFGKAAGTRYIYQYYMSKGLYNAEFLNVCVDSFFDIVKEHIGNLDFQITGREWSSIPLISGIILTARNKHNVDINSFLIRAERKSYGLHNYEEGIPNKKPVLIVDDICNSQNGYYHCNNVCAKELRLQTLPYIFGVINKYGSDNPEYEYDRYLTSHKIMSIVNKDDIDNVRRQIEPKSLVA